MPSPTFAALFGCQTSGWEIVASSSGCLTQFQFGAVFRRVVTEAGGHLGQFSALSFRMELPLVQLQLGLDRRVLEFSGSGVCLITALCPHYKTELQFHSDCLFFFLRFLPWKGVGCGA